MTSPSPGRGFKCGQCDRYYSSSSHLRRHEKTHLSHRPARCRFCNRSFVRSDILLRHSRTCKQKGSLPLSPGKPGRKRKACHGCSRGRLACDGDLPCESCLLKGLQCSYTNAQQHKELSFASCDGIASESQSPCQSTQDPSRQEIANPQRIPISFLLDYTDPMVRSPYDFHHMLAGPCARISGSADQLLRCTWVESDQFIDSWPSIFHAFVNLAALDPPTQSSDPLCGLDEEANMAQTIDRLIEHIEKAPVPHSGNTQLKAKARSFFSKENLVRFVNSFFENAYNSVPCIHKASFNINTSSLHLGLSVLLLGATSLSPQDAKAAEEYFDISEYSIFEGIEFRRLVYEEIHPRLTSGTIQLIQAALLTIMLQGSKNQLEVKRRIRVHRFPALVLVARLFNLTNAVNDIVLDNEMTNLQGYLYKETLVRVMAAIYLMDCHYVVFSRLPPHFRISDACFGLPKHDSVFNVVDTTAIASLDSNIRPQDPPLTLQSVIQLLMSDKPHRLCQHINTLFANFLIISALHCVLFDVQALTPGNLTSVDCALDRWKILWDLFHTSPQCPVMNTPGFMIHGLEYWWLAKMLVKEPHVFDMKGETAADSVEAFHNTIKRLKDPRRH